MARPRIEINWKVFDALCAVQCTQEEIAAHLKVSTDTIERACRRDKKQGFADYFSTKRKIGWSSLRKRQYTEAMKGNPTLLIWLGKQYLGQRDKIEHGGPNGMPLPGVNVNLSSLTDEELERFAQITAKLIGDPSGAAPTPQAAV
jgi:hypothetical protein